MSTSVLVLHRGNGNLPPIPDSQKKKGEDGLDEYKVLSSMGKGTFSLYIIFLLQALL